MTEFLNKKQGFTLAEGKPSLLVRGQNFNARKSILSSIRNSGEGKKAAFTLAEETCPPLEGGPKSLISRRGKSSCRSALRKQAESCGNEGKKIGRLEGRPVTFKFVNSLPSYPLTLQPSKKAAFTLAEVLITLAIIGVVAALTIPTLWAKVGSKVSENQQKVFQAKLIKGLNLAKTAGDIHDKYSSTEDFLRNGLAKHYKMVQICGADNLRDCIPYDEIKYMDGETEKTVKVADLKTAESIKLDAPFEDTATFVTADGIPVLLSYDKTCVVDTEKLDRSINSCVAGLYDINGSKAPNKYGFTLNDDGETIKAFTHDLHAFNGAGIGKQKLFDFEIAVKMFNPNDILNQIDSIPTILGSTNYHQAAYEFCNLNNARLPNISDLNKIGSALYADKNIELASPNDKVINYAESYNGNPNANTILELIGCLDSVFCYFRLDDKEDTAPTIIYLNKNSIEKKIRKWIRSRC